jgi:hypothetical protein
MSDLIMDRYAELSTMNVINDMADKLYEKITSKQPSLL